MGLYLALTAAWVIYGWLLLRNFNDLAEELSVIEYFLLALILLVGAPVFFLSEVFEGLLDLILPEGWDRD